MSDKSKAITIVVIGSFIAGAISPVIKIGLVTIPPMTFSFIRFLISGLCLLPFLLKKKPKFNRDFIALLFISLLPILNIILFVFGVKLTTASIAQMIYAATPILAVVFGYFLLGQRISSKKVLFILIGLIGVGIVVFLPLLNRYSLYSGNITGNMLISLAVLLYSIYVVLSKKYQNKYSPLVITSVFIFLGIVVTFPFFLVELRNNNYWISQINAQSVYVVLYVSILGTVSSYLLGQYAIKFGGPVLASLNLYLMPVFAYITSYILLGEKLTQGLIFGTILVFISIALTTYSK